MKWIEKLLLDYEFVSIENAYILHADCFEWLSRIPENSLHAIVTDPPYGVKEYDFDQLQKRVSGKGGIWRLPPAFDGHTRSPLPRFTALSHKEKRRLFLFFKEWSFLAVKSLRPGAHVFIATNAFMAQLLYAALVEGGLEFRGQTIRLVRTLRGGDRPKNAEKEFPHVSSLPRGCYEPWGIFRKSLPPKMKVSECLHEFQTGGLRRNEDGNPFCDVVESQRTPKQERSIVNHPSLKPQSFLRRIVYASLPLGKGIIADPFMGSGSTIAAALAVRLHAIGVEKYRDYFELSREAIPKLQTINTGSPETKSEAKRE